MTGPVLGIQIGLPTGGSTLQGNDGLGRFQIWLYPGMEGDSVEGCAAAPSGFIDNQDADAGELVEFNLENGVEYCIEVEDFEVEPSEIIAVFPGIQTDVSPAGFVENDEAGDVDLFVPLGD